VALAVPARRKRAKISRVQKSRFDLRRRLSLCSRLAGQSGRCRRPDAGLLVSCSGPRANDATVRGFGLVMRLALRRTVRAENAVVAPGAARPTACKNLCGPAVGGLAPVSWRGESLGLDALI
jgi:hypothetical protein